MSSLARTVGFVVLLAAACAALAAAVVLFVAGQRPAGSEHTIVWHVDEAAATETGAAEFAEAARSDAVLAAALERLGVDDPDAAEIEAFRGHVEVAVDAEDGASGVTSVVLRVEHGTREGAARRAEAVAAATEVWDRETAAQRAEAGLRDLDRHLEDLRERIRSLQVLGNGEEADLAAAMGEWTSLLERREALAARPDDGSDTGSLERVASEARPVSPIPARDAAGASAAAALFGAGLGVAWTLRRRRPQAATNLRGTHVLAAFPHDFHPNDPARDGAANDLQVELIGLTPDVRPRVFLISSASEQEGKTLVARRLAEEFALGGYTTLLVDGDLSSPSLVEQYGVGEEPATATTTLEWLQGSWIDPRVVRVELDRGATMDLVPQFFAARPAPGTAEALFEGFPRAVRCWGNYDVVVVDTSPVLGSGDACFLAHYVTGIVLVVDPRRTDRSRVHQVRGILRRSGGEVLGLVTNQAASAADMDEGWSWIDGPSEGASSAAHRTSVVPMDRTGS